MTIELGLLLALITGAIGIATFYLGRKSAVKKDGEEWGKLTTDISYIKHDIKDIKESVEGNYKDTKESIRRLHRRIDDHEREYHNKIITRND